MELKLAKDELNRLKDSGVFDTELSKLFGELVNVLEAVQMISGLPANNTVNSHCMEVLKYYKEVDEETEQVRVDAVKSVWEMIEEDYYPTMSRPNKRMFEKMREAINFELEVE